MILLANIVNFTNFENEFEILNTLNLEDNFKSQLFDLIPSLFNYEEEGEKLSFKLVLIKELSKNKNKLSNYVFQNLIKVDTKKINLEKSIKSIAPFSKNNWSLYISIENDTIEFGIYKDFGNIDSLGLKDILEDNYIEISKIDSFILEFENTSSHFYLHSSIRQKDTTINTKTNILGLAELITSKLETNDNLSSFKKNFINLLFNAFEKSNGSILLVQESIKELDDFFKNGVLLEHKINLYDEYINYITNCSKDDSIIQRYYSISGILSIALNIDGITIIDNQANLLAYNVFIDNEDIDTNIVSGGARKRAFHSIINSQKITGLCGVFFQSHDGYTELKEIL